MAEVTDLVPDASTRAIAASLREAGVLPKDAERFARQAVLEAGPREIPGIKALLMAVNDEVGRDLAKNYYLPRFDRI
jgi:hypothetical protein